jgi:flavin reductase (DIM6/NTAB) family NADH-FMN oxidoreductase RutF
MSEDRTREGIGAALGRIPGGLFVLTAQHEDRRQGIVVSWVQQCCFDPPMVGVAVAKGRAIMPLISESRQFGLCQLEEDERIISRKFSAPLDPQEDPFLGFELAQPKAAQVPILKGAMSYLECEVACHMDVDGDHDLFVGRVLAGEYLRGQPHVHIRENGFEY